MNQETINEAELDRRFRQVLKEIFSGRFEDTEAKGKREGRMKKIYVKSQTLSVSLLFSHSWYG